MLELTFGEQVKIVLNRKGMTIKQLAEMIEERTGKKMSRQNLTQRLSRDNFQEQDMRLIASILECPFYLSIMEENADSEYTSQDKKRKDMNIDIMDAEPEQLTLNLEFDEPEPAPKKQPKEEPADTFDHERDVTIGELVDIHEELNQMEPAETTGYEEEPAYEEQTGYESEYAEPEYAENEYAENEYTERDGYEPGDVEPAESEYTDQSRDEPEYDEQSYDEQAVYEQEPQYKERSEDEPQEDVNQILEEVAAIEAEEKKAREEREKEQEKEQEKPRGWRAYFPRRKKKHSEPDQEEKPETFAEQSEPEHAVNQEQSDELTGEPPQYEQYQETDQYQEANQEYEEYAQENEQEMEEEFTDTAQDWEAPEDGNVGEINPYTGMEYESNSVRMHPKRIGYVQVYDRSDHQWTDMTEWAFLGYQERKKALLGKDYEPPIYLD